MSGRMRSISLIGVGAIAGLAVSLGISAYAFRDTRSPIPLEEIRQFTDVFGAIKANYVEPVDDKKLINEAISGMLTGLDPHSSFLDADAFKDLQAGTQGEFGGLGIRLVPKTARSASSPRSTTHPRLVPASSPATSSSRSTTSSRAACHLPTRSS